MLKLKNAPGSSKDVKEIDIKRDFKMNVYI